MSLLENMEEHDEQGKGFPILCGMCLGDDPFVRMTRQKFAKACKSCDRPCDVFRWRPGSKGRPKTTQVCSTCSKLKNVCQSCFLDLEFGVSIQVRDSVLGNHLQYSQPVSEVGQQHLMERLERTITLGVTDSTIPVRSYDRSHAQEVARRLAQREPFYKRHVDSLCAFYMKGTCNRGRNCHQRHEKPPKGIQISSPAPPGDKRMKSLCIGGIDEHIEDEELKRRLAVFGPLKNFKQVEDQSLAFAEFENREDAEDAMRALWGELKIEDLQLVVNWHRKEKSDESDSEEETTESDQKRDMSTFWVSQPSNESSGLITVPPPPGIKRK